MMGLKVSRLLTFFILNKEKRRREIDKKNFTTSFFLGFLIIKSPIKGLFIICYFVSRFRPISIAIAPAITIKICITE